MAIGFSLFLVPKLYLGTRLSAKLCFGTVEDRETRRRLKDTYKQTKIPTRNGIAVASAFPSTTWEREKAEPICPYQ